MKKIIVVLAALLLAVSWIYAGGGSQQPPGGAASSASEASLTDDRSKTLDITWWGFNLAGILPYDGSIIQKEIEKRYNIRITNVPVDGYNNEQKNLLVATGVDFDVWIGWAGVGSMRQRVDTGLIRPVSLDMVNKFAPGIVKILADASPLWYALSSVDGVNYGFPHYSMGQGSPMGLSVRTGWLKNLGVTAIPKTLDELEALLVRFRTDDPDKNGKKDTWGLSLGGGNGDMRSLNPYLFTSYGVIIDQWGVDADGSPKWYAIDDNYRQALAKMNEWWAKEIFDPSILVNQTRMDNFTRVANGFAGGYFGSDWFLAAGTNPSALNAWTIYSNEHPDADIDSLTTHIPPVNGPKGALTHQYALPLSTQVTTFGRKTPDEKVVRLLSMFNDIMTQRDLFLLANYGIEGQHWAYDAEKRPVMKPEWSSAEKTTELGSYRFYPHVFLPIEYMDLSYNTRRFNAREAVQNYPLLPIHMAQLITTAEDAEYSAATRTIAQEYFWKTVTGEWNVDNTWNDYVNRWKAAGGQQIIDAKKKIAVELGLNGKSTTSP
jgi:putative aldouronate transport system substrate-binding protein